MKCYRLSHLTDRALLGALSELVARDRAITAELLAHLAEVDARKLYLPAAYPSMFAWCVGELKLSEDAAAKRIQAARAARRFPACFDALADGRLHLTGLGLLAPHLTPETADHLLAAAAHRTKAEIEQLLAERFPRPDVPTQVRPLAPASPGAEHAPAHVESRSVTPVLAGTHPGCGEAVPALGSSSYAELVLAHPPARPAPASSVPQQAEHAPAHVGTRDRLAPLAPTRYALQATIGQDTHDLLRQAQALLGHAVPAGDLDPVLNRALRLLVHKLERRRFAGTDRPRAGHRRSAQAGRYIPAAVRREVWQRDGGRCTFLSDSGHRCEARTRLEFDHVTPFARGGRSSARDLRLRCRAHNQHAADQAFGAGFMDRKREAGRRRRADARGAGIAAVQGSRPAGMLPPLPDSGQSSRLASGSAAGAHDPEVIPWLRALGFSQDEARRAAEHGAGLRAAPLEERVRAAITFLAPVAARRATRPGGVNAGASSG